MARKVKELLVEERSRIVVLSEEGYSIREIAKKTGISKSSVGYTLKKFKSTGSYSSQKRSGRPRKTTVGEDRFLQTLSKRNRRKTGPELAAEINRSRDTPISVTTVKRRLRQVGLRGCIAVRKPLLRKQNKKKRLEWAKSHQNWTD